MKRRNFLKSIMGGAFLAVGVKTLAGGRTWADPELPIEKYLTDPNEWYLVPTESQERDLVWYSQVQDPQSWGPKELQKLLDNGERTRINLAKEVFNERLD